MGYRGALFVAGGTGNVHFGDTGPTAGALSLLLLNARGALKGAGPGADFLQDLGAWGGNTAGFSALQRLGAANATRHFALTALPGCLMRHGRGQMTGGGRGAVGVFSSAGRGGGRPRVGGGWLFA